MAASSGVDGVDPVDAWPQAPMARTRSSRFTRGTYHSGLSARGSHAYGFTNHAISVMNSPVLPQSRRRVGLVAVEPSLFTTSMCEQPAALS